MAKKKTAKGASKRKPDTTTFEEALEKLEQIVSDLERGDLGLSEALSRYELGVKYLKACHAELAQAERQIELLSGVDADGNPVTEPLDDQPHETLTDKAASRGRRRSRTSSKSSSSGLQDDADVDAAGRLF